MCGRYVVFTEEENQELREIINGINERYKEDASKMKTGEIFPTNMAPVITANAENKRVANLFKWGFPNYRQSSGVIINARCETLHEKPTFKKLLTYGRCLVPASGFYEWKTIDQRKEKYLIHPTQKELMYFAGLYNNFIDKNGLPYTSFVIITTEANSQMSQIHTRMPVILGGAEAHTWIATSNVEKSSTYIVGTNSASIVGNTEFLSDDGITSILRSYSNQLILDKVS